jgi:hypothetical protein
VASSFGIFLTVNFVKCIGYRSAKGTSRSGKQLLVLNSASELSKSPNMHASVVLRDILNSPDKLGAASPEVMAKGCEAEGDTHRRVRRSLYSEPKQADSADCDNVLGSSRKRPNSPGSVEQGGIVKRRRIDYDSPCSQKRWRWLVRCSCGTRRDQL